MSYPCQVLRNRLNEKIFLFRDFAWISRARSRSAKAPEIYPPLAINSLAS
jgi:hypothetical protein